MITKDLLIEILSINLWDIIDMFMHESKEHFINIGEIYNQTIKDTTENVSYISIETFTKASNIFVIYLMWHAKFQFSLLFKDEAYLQKLMKMQNKTRDALLFQAREILKLYKIIIPFCNVIQSLYIFKNTLYRSNAFQDLFIERVANYIIEEISNGNVSMELINLLLSY